MKVYVEKRLNKDKKEYLVLYIDFGYAELPLSFKVAEIAQFADLKASDIANLPVGEKLHVANYTLIND